MTVLLLAALGLAHSWDETPDVLMLGNSYTQFNALESLVQQSLRDTVPSLDGARGERLSAGGLWLRDHLERVNGADARWAAALSGTEAWDVVVLQDQSLIPGLEGVAAGGGGAAYASSLEAVPQLDAHVAGTGAETVLFMTWGRRDGDRDYFPDVYPDFETMNARLDAGILAYATQPSVPERRLFVAPVGRAFGAVYERLKADGVVPETDGSDFHRLYSPDGSHPSPLGSGLAAGVFVATLTGYLPGEGQLPGVDASDAPWVADAIAAAVVPFGDLPFPWALDWADYAPPGDLDGDNPGGIVSGRLRCTAVGVSEDVADAGDLQVGGTHDGVAGCGRLWVLPGGSLAADSVTVGGDGATGSFVVAGGSARLGALSQPDGEALVRDGVLSVAGWSGTVGVQGGTLEVSAGAEGEGLRVGEEGTLQLEVDAAAGPLWLTSTAVLAGTLSVEELPAAAEVVLVTASSLDTSGLLASLPEGWSLETGPWEDGVALVAVAADEEDGPGTAETGLTEDSGSPADPAAPGKTGASEGCGCGGGAPLGGLSLWVAGVAAARRRRR